MAQVLSIHACMRYNNGMVMTSLSCISMMVMIS